VCGEGVRTTSPGAHASDYAGMSARYARQDGKTPGPLLQLDIGVRFGLCRSGGSSYLAKPKPRERAWQNQRGKKTLLSLTLV